MLEDFCKKKKHLAGSPYMKFLYPKTDIDMPTPDD